MTKRSVLRPGQTILFTLLSVLLSASAFAAVSPQDMRAEQLNNLEFMRNVFHSQYAPADWKKTYLGWDIDTQVDQAKAAVSGSTDTMGTRDYQKLLNLLFLSAHDYHTSISFASTEAATLPFTVKGAEGRYFFAYIDRNKLPEATFPFHEGDELVQFGGQPTDDAVKGILAQTIINSAETDQELAESRLTSRSAARGMDVPHGPIVITVKAKGSSDLVSHQLIWEYTPERIPSPVARASTEQSLDLSGGSNMNSILGRTMIPGDFVAVDGGSLVDNPYTVGARKTFTPDLGAKIWQSAATDPFDAYIFKNTDGKLIGYLRIPSYEANMYAKDIPTALADFRRDIVLFESTTDGMIIDQVNNPGGSVFYLYTLASMLSDQPIKAPRHHMKITQADVLQAYQTQAQLIDVKTDADAAKVLGDSLDGYPASYEVAQMTMSYCKFIISEFNAGHLLTAPYWISGVDQINPDKDHYTKPIMVITNALDFSGGDFFPATMQDNKRVTIFGTRTSGAGGYVMDYSYPNLFGVAGYRQTGSIAERADNNPIENLGVTPDVSYAITADDLQNGYSGYVTAIRTTMSAMTQTPVSH